MELTLRPIGEGDLPALSALYEQLVPGGTGPDNMKKALRQLDGDCLLLGPSGGRSWWVLPADSAARISPAAAVPFWRLRMSWWGRMPGDWAPAGC